MQIGISTTGVLTGKHWGVLQVNGQLGSQRTEWMSGSIPSPLHSTPTSGPKCTKQGFERRYGIWYQAESNYYYCTNFDLVSMPLGDQTQQRSVLRQSRMESAPRKLRQVCEHQWNAFHSSASLDALKQWTSEVEQTGDDENIACPLICTSRPESNKF